MLGNKGSDSPGSPVKEVGADVSLLNILIHLFLQNLTGLIFLVTANKFRQISQWFSLSQSCSQRTRTSFPSTASSLTDLISVFHFSIFFADDFTSSREESKDHTQSWSLSLFAFCCPDKMPWLKATWKEKVYFNLQVAAHSQGESGQELRQRPQRSMACSACSLLPLRTCPGVALATLGSPISNHNPENTLQTCP